MTHAHCIVSLSCLVFDSFLFFALLQVSLSLSFFLSTLSSEREGQPLRLRCRQCSAMAWHHRCVFLCSSVYVMRVRDIAQCVYVVWLWHFDIALPVAHTFILRCHVPPLPVLCLSVCLSLFSVRVGLFSPSSVLSLFALQLNCCAVPYLQLFLPCFLFICFAPFFPCSSLSLPSPSLNGETYSVALLLSRTLSHRGTIALFPSCPLFWIFFFWFPFIPFFSFLDFFFLQVVLDA